MSQKVNIRLERVYSEGKSYLRQPLENNVRLRPPTKKEMKKHGKLYRKQIQRAIILGRYEAD